MQIKYFDTIDSTNLYLYRNACEGKISEDVAVSSYEQTLGKGRRGRSFFSPGQTGIYLSLLLHPDASVAQSTLITTMMACAGAKALEQNGSPSIDIKWVNDLYIDNKKVGGILTECSPNIVDGKPSFVVVGIGINILNPQGGFPDDLSNKAGAVFNENMPMAQGKALREKIIKDIVENFGNYYKDFPNKHHLEEYRNRSFIIGREVLIVDGPVVTVTGIDEEFRLIVQNSHGEIQKLEAGEVSLII